MLLLFKPLGFIFLGSHIFSSRLPVTVTACKGNGLLRNSLKGCWKRRSRLKAPRRPLLRLPRGPPAQASRPTSTHLSFPGPPPRPPPGAALGVQRRLPRRPFPYPPPAEGRLAFEMRVPAVGAGRPLSSSSLRSPPSPYLTTTGPMEAGGAAVRAQTPLRPAIVARSFPPLARPAYQKLPRLAWPPGSD